MDCVGRVIDVNSLGSHDGPPEIGRNRPSHGRRTQIGRYAIDGHVSTRTPYRRVITGESLRTLLLTGKDDELYHSGHSFKTLPAIFLGSNAETLAPVPLYSV